MTDRFNALIVVLDKDYRDDDAEPILEAIRMIKCVQSVTGNVKNFGESWIAESRIKHELRSKLFDVFKDY